MSEPRLRADALRNREKLVAAAHAAFAERGLAAPLDEIARSAGVGSGTLYRHFPTREELISAVFIERTAENVAAAERALEHEDAWEGFSQWVRATCRAQAADRGLADVIAIGSPSSELKALRNRAYELFTTLLERAKASGALRSDLCPEDILLLLMGNAGIIANAGTVAPAASERFVAIALDGFRSEGASRAPRAPSALELVPGMGGGGSSGTGSDQVC